MNIYPTWWNTTVTIYNKYVNPTTDVISWFSHVVTGTFWKYTNNKVRIGDTLLETSDIVCRIRKSNEYMDNYLWDELVDEQPESESEVVPTKHDFFTLRKGDIIVKGEVTDVINEYTAGSRSSDLIKKYKNLQGCMVMKEFTVNTDGGRCNEHYLIKGE